MINLILTLCGFYLMWSSGGLSGDIGPDTPYYFAVGLAFVVMSAIHAAAYTITSYFDKKIGSITAEKIVEK